MGRVKSTNRFTKNHVSNLCRARYEGYLDKIVANKKLCPKCLTILSLEKFNKSSKRTNGYQLWCKQCGLNSKKVAYYAYRKERVSYLAREHLLKINYGLSMKEYEELLHKHGGTCKICNLYETQKSNPKGRIDSLRVDHDHKTGKVRGLLCSRCNFGLAQFKDSIKLLNNAIGYLKASYKGE